MDPTHTLEKPPPRPSLRRVAQLAGVSPSTASRALRGGQGLRPDTVERIRAAARTVGYRPQPMARSLRAGCLSMVGISAQPRLTLDASGALLPFWSTFLTSLIATFQAADHLSVLSFADDPAEGPDLPVDALILLHAAAGDAPDTSGGGRDLFGRVVAYTDALPAEWAAHVVPLRFRHPYDLIGHDAARMLTGRGCRHVLVVDRQEPFDFAATVTAATLRHLAQAGVAASRLSWSPGGPELHWASDEPVDGLFTLEPSLPTVAAVQASLPVLAERFAERVVSVTQRQTPPWQSRPGDSHLSFEGARCGEIAARGVLAALTEPGPPPAAIELPYRLAPVLGRS